jgi:phage shock protein PspC (stress-responsive transcriptional regulator)
MPPPSLRQLLFVLLVLAGVVGIPLSLLVWLIVTVVEWLR